MRKSNYDKSPSTVVKGTLWKGWSEVCKQLGLHYSAGNGTSCFIIVIECYQGIYLDELSSELNGLKPDKLICSLDFFKPAAVIEQMTFPFLTNDRLFGRRASFSYTDFLDTENVEYLKQQLQLLEGLVIIYGPAASLLVDSPDVLVYADMARWEIQQRSRRKEINGLGVNNKTEAPSLHYKRGYFIDWNVCDALKKKLIPEADYWLDTHSKGTPKMITGNTLREGLKKTAQRPFRVVPFFDPAPWGGQWMKDVCGLDKSQPNYGWCFDCVPEENSLYLNVSGELVEMQANNLVFYQTRELLGAPVEARFGQDFPIRFDFLDTMGGGNLSLQVHPVTQYIRDTFGIYYTQDESYYLLDAEEGATVFLGLQTGVNPEEMVTALHEAQQGGAPFDAEKYVNLWPAKKHDHYLIPAGTVHCSGTGAMVLEISATPSIFTFKLWDWGRLGLDGLPRPINITHGANVIQWERQTDFVREQLVNRVDVIAQGDGWKEERTGLHENEFIETRRHWFTNKVLHHTGGGVNVLNVVEGDELIVESPSGAFEPFVVHYAETFIIPACVDEYTIRSGDEAATKTCGTIKAYVRFRD